VNLAPEAALVKLLRAYGEEPAAAAIARAIIARRGIAPITRTLDLACIVAAAVRRAAGDGEVEDIEGSRLLLEEGEGGGGGSRGRSGRPRKRGHPALRTFQALRIAVNGELAALEALLAAAPQLLAPGGIMQVITFHSLEDRLVKKAFAALCSGGASAGFELAVQGVLTASEQELEDNFRARSAKLRALRRRG